MYTDEDQYNAGEGGCICALAVAMLVLMLVGGLAGLGVLAMQWMKYL